MKKYIPFFFAVASLLFFATSTNTYNFILSGTVADGKQPLSNVKVSLERLTEPSVFKELYYQISALNGGYILRFPAKNKRPILLYYEKMGYGKIKFRYIPTADDNAPAKTYTPRTLKIAYMFNFKRYKDDAFVGSFNRKNLILFDTAMTTAYSDTLLLNEVDYFSDVSREAFHTLDNAKLSNAYWYKVDLVHNKHKKNGYVLYENEKEIVKP